MRDSGTEYNAIINKNQKRIAVDSLWIESVEVEQVRTMLVDNGIKSQAVAPAGGEILHLDARVTFVHAREQEKGKGEAIRGSDTERRGIRKEGPRRSKRVRSAEEKASRRSANYKDRETPKHESEVAQPAQSKKMKRK